MLAGINASFIEEACILSILDRLYLDRRCKEFVLSFDITVKLFCCPKKKVVSYLKLQSRATLFLFDCIK